MTETLEILTSPSLSGVPHGFFTRKGGVSTGLYGSLQCGWGAKADTRDNVAENRRRVAEALSVSLVATGHQTHSAIAGHVSDADWSPDATPQVDAVVVDRPGAAAGALSADCAPVLLFDPEARVAAAVHAGWRGALGGVLEASVQAMTDRGAAAARIRGAVGPCIGPENYEVGPEFRDQFVAHDAQNARFFAPSAPNGKTKFDLPSYVSARLAAVGVVADWIGACTYADADRFFSNRRAVHRGDADYGRLIAAIAVPEA